MKTGLRLLAAPILGLYLLSFSACKGYEVLPDSYMLRGHDYFINIPEWVAFYAGPELTEDSLWQGNIPPLSGRKLSRKQTKVLRQLGYNRNDYSVLFRSNEHSPLDFYAVVNNKPNSKEGQNVRLLNTALLQQKKISEGHWYYNIYRRGKHSYYHAVVPFSERLFNEKYISLIFPVSENTEVAAEKLIAENIRAIHSREHKHTRSKTVIGTCGEDVQVDYYHGYIIPDDKINYNEYMLVAAYQSLENGSRELIYYRILDPGLRMGAFRICPGEYTLEYLTLDGEVRWSSPFSPIPQEN